MHDITSLIGSYWWLVFVIPPVFGGVLQKHHRRRLAVLAAKGQLAEKRNAALHPPEPQPICGCSHHLSFHNPHTSGCAVDDCRCQQYVGPEPLGHVFALPLIDPGAGGGDPSAAGQPSISQDAAPH